MLKIQPTQQHINSVLCGDTKLHKQPISTSHYSTVLLLSLLLFAVSLLMLIAFLLSHGVLSMPYLTIQPCLACQTAPDMPVCRLQNDVLDVLPKLPNMMWDLHEHGRPEPATFQIKVP